MSKSFAWSKVWDKSVPWYMNFHIKPIKVNGYVFLLLVLFLSWSYAHDVESYKEVYESPCSYCPLVVLENSSFGERFVCNSGGDVLWMMNGSRNSTFDYSVSAIR